MPTTANEKVEGRNGVVVPKFERDEDRPVGYRTYEVHQRERVGESTEKIQAIKLQSDDFRRDPYPYLEILRSHYPFYRDWLANCYWVTPYNDVTSIYVDDANFETRSKLWRYGLEGMGRDLGTALPLLEAEARYTDAHAQSAAERLLAGMGKNTGDLARDFAAQLPLELLCGLLDVPAEDRARFTALYWRMQRGVSWLPALQQDGRVALDELVAYLEAMISERGDGDDLLSVMRSLDIEGGPVTARDMAVTLLERDHETLHGALANLWFLLLTHLDEFSKARSERRLMKLAYLETLRHSTPVLCVDRFARHEVERFGKLIPEGARLVCAAAAANRDPGVFRDPDRFIVDRRDLCQREPRGQYRADGLATGIAFGLGKPSLHPAIPEDRPRSRYALVRDTAVTASMQVVEMLEDLRLVADATPHLTALTVGEMHTCWALPVSYRRSHG